MELSWIDPVYYDVIQKCLALSIMYRAIINRPKCSNPALKQHDTTKSMESSHRAWYRTPHFPIKSNPAQLNDAILKTNQMYVLCDLVSRRVGIAPLVAWEPGMAMLVFPQLTFVPWSENEWMLEKLIRDGEVNGRRWRTLVENLKKIVMFPFLETSSVNYIYFFNM